MSHAKRGRPRGSPNRTTNEAKEAILLAYRGIGGVEKLIEWILKSDENQTIFWTKIFTRLLPRPALDEAAAAEAPPPIRGALELPTPEWVKQLEKKGFFNAGVSAAATAAATAAVTAAAEAATTGAPGGARGVPLGNWEDGP